MIAKFLDEKFEKSRNHPELSIVIVDSDSPDLTLNCLKSLYENPPRREFEVILVENESASNCARLVKDQHPSIRIIIAPQPQGFSKNYNLGIKQTDGDFVLILNNDTIVHPGAFDALVDFISDRPEFGIVGPKLLSMDGHIQTVCARPFITPVSYVLIQFILDLALPTGKMWDSYRRWRLSNAKSGSVPCLSGACMLIPRRVMNKVGILDESYTFYYEDIDWCRRVYNYGFQIGYVAEAEFTHLGDQSLSRVKELAKQGEYRGAIRYFRQYHHLTKLGEFGLWTITLLSYAFRAAIYSFSGLNTGKHPYSTSYRRLSQWIIGEFPLFDKVIQTGK